MVLILLVIILMLCMFVIFKIDTGILSRIFTFEARRHYTAENMGNILLITKPQTNSLEPYF